MTVNGPRDIVSPETPDEDRPAGGRRRYTMRVRAKRQSETRRRIVDAAIAIGMDQGPLRATLAAIAERAGVERATVYRHFPDQRSVLRAAAMVLLERYPPPDPSRWPPDEPAARRVRRGLTELYEHYRTVGPMARAALRDAAVAPGLVPLDVRDAYLRRIEDALLATIGASRRRTTVRHALRHALDIGTWLSLTERQGMSDRAAARLMATFVLALATSDRGSR